MYLRMQSIKTYDPKLLHVNTLKFHSIIFFWNNKIFHHNLMWQDTYIDINAIWTNFKLFMDFKIWYIIKLIFLIILHSKHVHPIKPIAILQPFIFLSLINVIIVIYYLYSFIGYFFSNLTHLCKIGSKKLLLLECNASFIKHMSHSLLNNLKPYQPTLQIYWNNI